MNRIVHLLGFITTFVFILFITFKSFGEIVSSERLEQRGVIPQCLEGDDFNQILSYIENSYSYYFSGLSLHDTQYRVSYHIFLNWENGKWAIFVQLMENGFRGFGKKVLCVLYNGNSYSFSDTK